MNILLEKVGGPRIITIPCVRVTKQPAPIPSPFVRTDNVLSISQQIRHQTGAKDRLAISILRCVYILKLS